MAEDRTSLRNEAPSFEDLRAASRQLLIDTGAALHRLFDATVAAATPAKPVEAPVVVRRDERSR